jgi:DNA-binding winged helix-turn-helix (wHTH) protein
MNEQTKHFYEFGPFRFDLEEHTLWRDGRPVPLPPKAMETLFLLLRNAGRLVDKDKLMKEVWHEAFVEEGNLNKNIFLLRKTFGQWDGGRVYIETVPKRGFRFVAPVEDLPAGQSEDTGATEISVTPLPIEGKNEAPRHASRFISLIFGLVILAVGGMVIVWSKLNNSLPKIVSAKQITNDGLPKTSGPVSDGSRIYFGEFSGGRNILKEVSKTGGETVEIQTSVPDPLIEDFSQEDSQLLVQAGRDQWNPEGSAFWLVPVPRGPTRRMEGVVGRAGGWVPEFFERRVEI